MGERRGVGRVWEVGALGVGGRDRWQQARLKMCVGINAHACGLRSAGEAAPRRGALRGGCAGEGRG